MLRVSSASSEVQDSKASTDSCSSGEGAGRLELGDCAGSVEASRLVPLGTEGVGLGDAGGERLSH